jgi:lipopolysaccharide export system protein LptC
MRLIIPIVSVLLAIALAGIVWLLEVEHEQAQEISKLKAEVSHCGEQRRPIP